MTILTPTGKLSFKTTAVWHFFPPVAMLHIIEPQPFINLPIPVHVFSRAIRLVIVEVAHEHVPIRVVERSLPFCLSTHPHSDILGPVWPYLSTKTVLLLRLHFELTGIHTPVTYLEITDFFNSFHSFAGGGKRCVVDNLFDEIEVFSIREGRRT